MYKLTKGGLLMVCFCACASTNAVALDAACTGCINFHLCATLAGYTMYADEGQSDIDDKVREQVMDQCQNVYGETPGDYDMAVYFMENALNAGIGMAYDYIQGGDTDMFAEAVKYAKVVALNDCYENYYCDAYNQCHDEYGDKYVLSIGNDSWDTGAAIGCIQCPGDGKFTGTAGIIAGYSWGQSSCVIPANTTFSDTTGSYVYNDSCVYIPTVEEILVNGYF